jgi:predicted O-methyltransferase YrrM
MDARMRMEKVGQVQERQMANPAAANTITIPNTNPRYQFTRDYVTPYIPQWKAFLGKFSGRPDVHFLEVGSFEGCSAMWFLDNILTHPSSTMTCVDFFETPEYEARFNHNVEVSGNADRLTVLRGPSREMIPRLHGKRMFDAIYIDAGHTAEEVYVDTSLCWPVLKAGGVVTFDDYEWRLHRPLEKRPQLGIDRFLAEHRGEIEVLHKAYTLVAVKTS